MLFSRCCFSSVYTTTLPGAQVFHVLLQFAVVNYEHKIDSGCYQAKQNGQQCYSWVDEILKITSAAHYVGVAILLADEVDEELSLQSIDSLYND